MDAVQFQTVEAWGSYMGVQLQVVEKEALL